MKRKPYPVLLSAFALLLLMGAAAPEDQSGPMLAEEESSVSAQVDSPPASEAELDADVNQDQLNDKADASVVPDESAPQPEPEPVSPSEPEKVSEPEAETEPKAEAEPRDEQLMIDGEPAPLTLNKMFYHDTTYVGMAAMVQLLDPTAKITWEQATQSITVTSDKLNLSAKLGQRYIVANGEYLNMAEPLGALNNRTMIPMATLVKAMGGTVWWNPENRVTYVTRGSGAIVPGTGESEPAPEPKPEPPKPEPPKPEPPKPEPPKPAPGDKQLLIDNKPAPLTLNKKFYRDTTYVAMVPMVQLLDPSAKISWNQATETVTVTSSKLKLTGKLGQLYIEANGRCLYLTEPLHAENNRTMIPMAVLIKAMGGKVWWNPENRVTYVTRGNGGITSGSQFYNENDLFWLSRVIYAEAGNQSLEGQMAVGNVVLNRVADPVFPNTVKGVIAQKNQFTTYQGGKLAERTPSAKSVLAAKLVMDGGVVEETRGALYFDNSDSSWAATHKTCIAVFGGHKFYK